MSAIDLRLGSCLDPLTGLASLPDKSIDVTITDPPYDEHVHSAARTGARARGEIVDKGSSVRAKFNRKRELGFDAITRGGMDATATHLARVTRRWSLVFCALEMIHDWRGALEGAGLQYVRTAVWHKLNSTPQFTGDRPAVAVEAIVIAHPRGRKRWNGGGKHGIYAHPIVLNRGAGEVRMHTTQKPLALMRALVEDFTDPGEVILDPYAGSGTTGMAAVMAGRRFVGWEQSPDYHAIATRRLAGDEGMPRPEQPSLFGAGAL